MQQSRAVSIASIVWVVSCQLDEWGVTPYKVTEVNLAYACESKMSTMHECSILSQEIALRRESQCAYHVLITQTLVLRGTKRCASQEPGKAKIHLIYLTKDFSLVTRTTWSIGTLSHRVCRHQILAWLKPVTIKPKHSNPGMHTARYSHSLTYAESCNVTMTQYDMTGNPGFLSIRCWKHAVEFHDLKAVLVSNKNQ